LFAVVSNKDFNLILVLALPERQGRFAGDVLAPKEKLCERLLCTE
jgi:hypothetical protein